MEDNGLKYIVDIADGQKTGFFLIKENQESL